MRNRSLVPAALLVLTLAPRAGAAQSMTIHPVPGNVFSFEAGHPFLRNGESAISLAGFAGYRHAFPKAVLVAELPFAHLGGDNSSTVIGNAYVGGEIPLARLVQVSAGVRLPTQSGDGDAAFVGTMVDFDRIDAFYDDAVTLRAVLESRTPPSGLAVDWHAGAVHSRSTAESTYSQSMAAYGLGMSMRGEGAAGGAGVIGRMLISDLGDASIEDRSFHMLDMWADFGSGIVRPGVSIRVPLDSDIRDNMRAVASLRLQVLVR